MTGVPYKDQPRATNDGVLLVGAQLLVSESGTDTLAAAYADGDLSTPLTNPVPSDSAGRFPAVFVGDDEYRIRLFYDGALQWEVDPYEGILPGSAVLQPLDDSGHPMPFAELTFYRAGTTILADVFDSAELDDTISNPVIADSDGIFETIYLDGDSHYRVLLHDRNGVLCQDIDGYRSPQILTAGELA